jgi:hypothetical protein
MGNYLYKIATFGSILLAILSLFLIDGIEFILLSFSFNLLLAYLYTLKSVRRIPGMILLLLNNFIYIQIPILYMFSKGVEYNFQGFILTPNIDSFYYESMFTGSLFFISCFLFLIFGLLIGNSLKFKKKLVAEQFKSPNTLYTWIIIAFITFYFIFLDNSANVSARTEEVAKGVNIFAFFFSDKTFQTIFPVLFFLIPIKSKTKSLTWFFLILLLFFALNMQGSSKASILLIFTAFFLTPIAIFYNENNKEVIWPRRQLFIFGIAISIPLFIFTSLARELSGTGVTISWELLNNLYSQVGDVDLGIVSDLILLRLSAMYNNFILIFSHYSKEIDFSYRLHFASYSWASFLNLVLPGTPFPEAYVPTSQLFPKVLEQNIMESNLDNIALRQQANTQPYSYFGFLMIVFGGTLTIILSFFSGVLFSLIYRLISKTYIKAVLVFAFSVIFNSYALEAGLQFIIITFLTSALMVYLLKFFDSLKFNK